MATGGAADHPRTTTTVASGFTSLEGALYDGANVWVTDNGANKLLKLDSFGAILQTVTVGSAPFWPVFDGANIWVPNANSSSVSVVRASTGAVLATLTGNGLGERFSRRSMESASWSPTGLAIQYPFGRRPT